MPLDDARANLAEIMRGVFYRHEFARRNTAVIEAAKSLFADLDIPVSRGGTYLSQEPPRYFSHLLISRSKTPALRRKMKAFLDEHRVFPMSQPSDTPFFPRESKDIANKEVTDRTEMWESLLMFEYFAMSILGLDSPVMFPVMPLGEFHSREKTTWLGDGFSSRRCGFPLFVDFAVPTKTSYAYIAMLQFLENRADRPETREQKELRKKKRKTKGSPIAVLQWPEYDGYLEAHDLWQKIAKIEKAEGGDRRRPQSIAEDMVKLMKKYPQERSKPSKHPIQAAKRRFYLWKDCALVLVDGGYKKII